MRYLILLVSLFLIQGCSQDKKPLEKNENKKIIKNIDNYSLFNDKDSLFFDKDRGYYVDPKNNQKAGTTELKINIEAQPSLEINRKNINFGEILPKQQVTAKILLKNNGSSVLKNLKLDIPSKKITILKNNCPTILSINQICDLKLNIKSDHLDLGKFYETIKIKTDRTLNYLPININKVNKTKSKFTHEIFTQKLVKKLRFYNSGPGVISSIIITSKNIDNVKDGCKSSSLAQGQSCSVDLTGVHADAWVQAYDQNLDIKSDIVNIPLIEEKGFSVSDKKGKISSSEGIINNDSIKSFDSDDNSNSKIKDVIIENHKMSEQAILNKRIEDERKAKEKELKKKLDDEKLAKEQEIKKQLDEDKKVADAIAQAEQIKALELKKQQEELAKQELLAKQKEEQRIKDELLAKQKEEKRLKDELEKKELDAKKTEELAKKEALEKEIAEKKAIEDQRKLDEKNQNFLLKEQEELAKKEAKEKALAEKKARELAEKARIDQLKRDEDETARIAKEALKLRNEQIALEKLAEKEKQEELKRKEILLKKEQDLIAQKELLSKVEAEKIAKEIESQKQKIVRDETIKAEKDKKLLEEEQKRELKRQQELTLKLEKEKLAHEAKEKQIAANLELAEKKKQEDILKQQELLAKKEAKEREIAEQKAKAQEEKRKQDEIRAEREKVKDLAIQAALVEKENKRIEEEALKKEKIIQAHKDAMDAEEKRRKDKEIADQQALYAKEQAKEKAEAIRIEREEKSRIKASEALALKQKIAEEKEQARILIEDKKKKEAEEKEARIAFLIQEKELKKQQIEAAKIVVQKKVIEEKIQKELIAQEKRFQEEKAIQQMKEEAVKASILKKEQELLAQKELLIKVQSDKDEAQKQKEIEDLKQNHQAIKMAQEKEQAEKIEQEELKNKESEIRKLNEKIVIAEQKKESSEKENVSVVSKNIDVQEKVIGTSSISDEKQKLSNLLEKKSQEKRVTEESSGKGEITVSKTIVDKVSDAPAINKDYVTIRSNDEISISIYNGLNLYGLFLSNVLDNIEDIKALSSEKIMIENGGVASSNEVITSTNRSMINSDASNLDRDISVTVKTDKVGKTCYMTQSVFDFVQCKVTGFSFKVSNLIDTLKVKSFSVAIDSIISNSLPMKKYTLTQVANRVSPIAGFDNQIIFRDSYYFTAKMGNETRIFKMNSGNIYQISNNNENSDNPESMLIHKGELYFSGLDESGKRKLFKTNESNITQVSNVNSKGDDNLFPMLSLGNTLFLKYKTNDQYELAKLEDGKVISTGVKISEKSKAIEYEGKAYFSCYNEGYSKLCEYSNKKVRVVSNTSGTYDSPYNLIEYRGYLVFSANNKEGNNKLYKFTGTSISQISDISNGSDEISNLHIYGNELIFVANNKNSKRKLFAYDSRSIYQISNIRDGLNDVTSDVYKNAVSFAEYNGELFFVAKNNNNGFKVFKYDGEIISQISNINLMDVNVNQTGSDFPYNLFRYKGSLYFGAFVNSGGSKLFKLESEISE